jgi:hypothetical protein
MLGMKIRGIHRRSGSEPVNSEQPGLVAGDPEYSAYENFCRSAIPISRSVIEAIRLVCKTSGAPFLMDKKN